jgi:hypothetical protein
MPFWIIPVIKYYDNTIYDNADYCCTMTFVSVNLMASKILIKRCRL